MLQAPRGSGTVRSDDDAASAAFERGQRDVLEAIATGARLGHVLERVVLLVEGRAAGMRCSILLLDAERGCLRHGAAPHLPRAFVAAIDGAAIGPAAGSCGTAAYRAERVVVDDIATHPSWADYKDAALKHGLRACWSTPIFSIGRQVLGTFAMYYDEPRGPADHERAWVDRATHLAAIAIERDQARETLRAHELQISEQAALLDQAKDAIVVRDVDGVVRFWSKGAERLYGWTRAEALGRPIADLVSTDLQALADAERRLIARGEWTGELTYVTKKDGRALEVEGRWSLLRGRPGAPTSVLAIDTDVTERNKLHVHVMQAQRMDSLGTLAGGIAHDFNNILVSLTANAAFALEALPPEHAAREFLAEIAQAGHRATGLVRQILTFGRRQEPRAELVRPGDVAVEVHKLLRATLPSTVELRLVVAPDAPMISADPTQVHQVLMNLLTNAAQALPDARGHIELRVERCDLTRPLATSTVELPAGPYARLVVVDDGTGMNAATRARIFDPFFTTKGPSVGTGLGLAVVHGIAKCHDGGVVVDSAPGAGSTFSVYFPASTLVASATPPAPAPGTRGAGQRVLCLDDEDAIVRITVRRLERLGYRVTGETDARRALATFEEAPDAFDALITDHSMPGLTGVELVRAFRRLRPALPVVLTSGLVDEDVTRALAALGVEQILLKPSTTEELATALEAALAGPRR